VRGGVGKKPGELREKNPPKPGVVGKVLKMGKGDGVKGNYYLYKCMYKRITNNLLKILDSQCEIDLPTNQGPNMIWVGRLDTYCMPPPCTHGVFGDRWREWWDSNPG